MKRKGAKARTNDQTYALSNAYSFLIHRSLGPYEYICALNYDD